MAITTTQALTVAIAYSQAEQAQLLKNEFKENIYGALDAFMASTEEFVIGGAATIANMKKQAGHDVKIPVAQRRTVTINNTGASCTPSGSSSTALLTPTWTPYSGSFVLPMSLLINNQVGFEAMFAVEMKNFLRSAHELMTTDALTFLQNNRSASNAGTINTFDAGQDIMFAAASSVNDYFGGMIAEMKQNKYYGPYFNVQSLGYGELQLNKQQAQGAGNQTNLQYQFDQNLWKHYFDSTLEPAATTSTIANYIFAPGAVGMIPWVREDFRMGFDTGKERWGTMQDPRFPNVTWGIFVTIGCADLSAGYTPGTHYTNGINIGYSFECYVSYNKQYDSSGTDSGIYAYELLRT